MKKLVKLLTFMLATVFTTFFLVSAGEASIHTLQIKNGKSVLATARVDDTTPNKGLYSYVVDSTERLWRQCFWYRIGPTGKEASLESLSLTGVIPPTTTNPNTLTLTYTLPATFEITVNYVLTYPTGGTPRLQKNLTIKNISATALDYHLFEFTDLDVSSTAVQNDNVEAVGNKIYQNGEQADGSGVTMVHEATLPPSSYDFDSLDIYILPDLNDDAPTQLSSPQTTYRYGDDMQFALQWDLVIPTSQSVSFTINDDLYYTLPMAGAKTHTGCVTYGGQVDYSISFDNLANPLDSLTNIKIIDLLPAHTTPAFTPPAPGAEYHPSAHRVTWNLPSLAAGAIQQTRQLSIAANSPVDFKNELLLVSDQAFPTRISDPAVLCNHPPTMNSIMNASINEGAPFSLQTIALDPDTQDSLSYSLNNAPAGMTISAAGLISYPAGVAGVYTVTVTATDNGSAPLSVSRTFTLTVISPNHSPVFTSTPSLAAAYNRPFIYEITATDPDGDSLSYGLTNAPQGMSISGNVVSWTPTAAQGGAHAVRVQVSDGKSYSYQDFTIAVSATLTGTTGKGDLDGNGIEDIADALLALQFAVKLKIPSPTELSKGDVAPIVNGKSEPNGEIDIADALAFLRKLVGLLTW